MPQRGPLGNFARASTAPHASRMSIVYRPAAATLCAAKSALRNNFADTHPPSPHTHGYAALWLPAVVELLSSVGDPAAVRYVGHENFYRWNIQPHVRFRDPGPRRATCTGRL